MKLQTIIAKKVQKIVDKAIGVGLMQETNTAEGERYVTPGMPELIRTAAAESCVLLKNDGTLPLKKEEEIAVFGRCQLDWFYVGYGSGGDVHPPYTVNLCDGLKNAGAKVNASMLECYTDWTTQKENEADSGWWGHWPYNYPEMPLNPYLVKEVARNCRTAVVVIGRAAGEDRENKLEKGSYFLTDEENEMLRVVTEAFDKVVLLLDIGNIMDLSWLKGYDQELSAVMIVWQGGMESGNAVCDVLYGDVNPSGRLTDTIAVRWEDYPSSDNFGGTEFNEYKEGIYVGYRYFDRHPEKVLYPFGYGLSYTTFKTEVLSLEEKGRKVTVKAEVTNTGRCAGKETVLLWCHQPQEGLDKAERVLCAFAKTDILQPGKSETVTLNFTLKDISSYDEERHAFVLEKGEYTFDANGADGGSITMDEEKLIEQCESIGLAGEELKSVILERLPKEIPVYDGKATLADVKAGVITLEEFVGTLSDKELEALTRGHGMMNSSYGTTGNAGSFGGVIQSLQDKGVDAVITSDGPAGLRLALFTSLIPCGTALASTFDVKLVEKLHEKMGQEMAHFGVDVQLAPGMNIHRNPLCGRNFEYYSEDPLVSGKIAAAVVRGVQSTGKSSCPKHFACNNQETKRNTNDSRVSERALREIYLRNFEIVVKEAKPHVIMSSYNKVNGVWSHYNYNLCTTVLRKEWGYEGTVITDWWMQKSASPEFPKLKDNAYRVRAQVDVLMPGDMGKAAKKYKSDGTLLNTLGEPEGMTKAELQRSAMNVLKLVMKIK